MGFPPSRIYKLTFVMLLVGFLLRLPRHVSADTEPGPRDYAVPVHGGDYSFVMLVPESRIFSPQAMDATLRKQYPQSGLYDTRRQTPKLIYTVDWYANPSVPWAYESKPSSDQPESLATHQFFRNGQYLVRMGPWPGHYGILPRPAKAYQALAVAFYEWGQLLNEYMVADLVEQPEQLPHSVSHYTWLSQAHLDDETGVFTLQTLEGKTYAFDVRSGQIIPSDSVISERYPPLIFVMMGMGGVALILAALVLRRKHNARIQPIGSSSDKEQE